MKGMVSKHHHQDYLTDSKEHGMHLGLAMPFAN